MMKSKNKIVIALMIFLIFILGFFIFLKISYIQKDIAIQQKYLDAIAEENKKKEKINNIKNHYAEVVEATIDATIYKKYNEEYKKAGIIYKGNIISLAEEPIDEKTIYFHNEDLDIYINYNDVMPTQEQIIKDNRFKNYIPFNENIVTNDNYTIYSANGTKLYTFDEKAEYPIIIKEDDMYYIVFNGELGYINKKDVNEIVDHQNTELIPVNSVPVLNYHFVYDPKVTNCNQRICMTEELYDEHIKYLKANYLDLTMEEFDLFMNNKIRLPKSVLVTHDDGWLYESAIKILDKNEFHATYFLISGTYKMLASDYVEYHSHTHNMHIRGQCSGGQGGGIKCLSEQKIQDDLQKSREALNNTEYFCYPFYEWNKYAINQLKKAGFKLAFIGGNRNAKPSDNHYLVPRYPIYRTMTVADLQKMF